MKRLSFLALLAAALLGSTYAWAMIGRGPTAGTEGAGCACGVCRCPVCNGEVCTCEVCECVDCACAG
jgi:hypothetical protein